MRSLVEILFADKRGDFSLGKAIVFFITLIIVVWLLCASIINVPAGHKGVAVAGFGVGKQYNEGWQWKNPLTKVEDVRWNTQIVKEVISARSADGYNVDIDLAVRYHIEELWVGNVRVNNPDYNNTVIKSVLRSEARKVVADWNMTGEMMNNQRSAYEGEVAHRVTEKLLQYHIIAEEIMLRNLDFPARVNSAWENRASAEVDVETASFELDAEEKRALKEVVKANAEANSTIILAEGQAEALRILAAEGEALDNETMQYILSLRYIAMLKDENCNVEFVILSDGNNPFILSMDEMLQAELPETPPASGNTTAP